MKVYMEVYGCSANVADFEIMAGLLKKGGHQLVSDAENSDMNIIVTCVVKTPTEQRMVHKIKKLQIFETPLIIAGCMPKSERELAKKIAPEASLLGPNSIHKIVDVVNTTMKYGRTEFLKDLKEAKVCLPRVRRNPVISIISIAKGCAWQKCAYCIVKFARGPLLSYPLKLIIKEIQQSLREGCREIWVTGQDTAAYGLDGGENLAELLSEICNIRGNFFVRVGMMNPSNVQDMLHQLIKNFKNEKIFKFLHIPVQSGDDEVLRLMRRSYSVEDFKRIVYSFKEEIPKITIATDLICGFPGESVQAFKRSLRLMEEIKPDILNISKFFPRPKTLAEGMRQLPGSEIKERSRRATRLFNRIRAERNRTWMGWKGEILVDEIGKNGSWIGRNFAYKPIVVKSHERVLGKFINVSVKKVFPSYLEAEYL